MPRAKTNGVVGPPPKKVAAKRKATGYKRPVPIPLGEVITDVQKQQWKIGTSIGCGGFGEIYSATKNGSSHKVSDYPFVVKIEPHDNGPLFVEMHFYMRNAKFTDIEDFRKKRGIKSLGMPHFVGHGSHDLNNIKHRFIVMPRYGRDVWSLFLENNRSMPLYTVYRLAIQMIDVLEYIHRCTYVHADLKGSNILLGFGKGGSDQAFLVDFGLASHYTTKDFKADPKKMHNGTIEYTSRDAHNGVPTMRGDMEILAYNLIHWTGISLPWEAGNILANPTKVQEAKEKFMDSIASSFSVLYSGKEAPAPILNFTKDIGQMKYNESPAYDKLRKYFETGLKVIGKSNSGDLVFKMSPEKSAPRKTKSGRLRIRSPIQEESDDDENVPIRKKTPIKKPMKTATKRSSSDEQTPESPKPKRGRRATTDTDPNLIINSEITSRGSKKKGNTYQFNIELDVSVDADVIVNVKRKPKNISPSKRGQSLSDDALNRTDNSESSTPIAKAKIIRKNAKAAERTTRVSPRGKASK